MRRRIDAKLIITLYDLTWDENNLGTFSHHLGDLYDVRNISVWDEDPRRMTCDVTTNFEDDISTAETVAYCLDDDLFELGFGLDSIQVLEEKITDL